MAVLAATLLALACRDASAPPGPISGLRLSTDSAVVHVDSTLQLTAVVLDPAGDSLAGRRVAWFVFDTSIATVDGTGLLRGVEVGSTSLVAASDSAVVRVPVTGVVRFITVSLGFGMACALSHDGRPYCWGDAIGPEGSPRRVPGAPPLRTVSAGWWAACGLSESGAAHCWGSQTPLGDGRDSASASAVAVTGGLSFSDLVAGWSHFCGLTAGGAAYCWGSGGAQMASATQERLLLPQPAAPDLHFASIAAGDAHTCGISLQGEVYCWGGNYGGELGSLVHDPGRCHHPCTATPTIVQGAPALVFIVGGGGHTCGLTAAGDAYCWGDNWYGQLGDTVRTGCLYSIWNHGYPCSASPVLVSGGYRFASLAAGENHTCGLTGTGEALCWGSNDHGQLGNGAYISGARATPAGGGLHFVHLSARGDATCGVGTDGVIYCWGDDWFNVLGNGPRVVYRNLPTRVLFQR